MPGKMGEKREGKPKVSPERTFGNYRKYFEFCIEWERVTGELLMTNSRTYEQGKMKLEEAALKQTEMTMLIERKLI